MPRRLLPIAVSLALAAAAVAAAASPPADQALIAAWNRVPPAELDALWVGAQETAGIVAVEPEHHAVGNQAARKKVWGFLNTLFQLVKGKEPIWFPVDTVKRTVCGAESFWSYHLLGNERDLHPWLHHHPNPFAHLLDERHGAAVAGTRVLDFSSCAEVKGKALPCFYGEVTAPKAFDQWFCGGAGLACAGRLSHDPGAAPAGFSRPAQMCFHGPWVLERVHDWRPEIHPAEVLWTRPQAGATSWRVALLPDGSDRFSKDGHFERRTPGAMRVWSADRPVELWVAFDYDAAEGLELDLSYLEMPGDGAQRTQPLRLAGAEGAFTALPSPSSDVLAAARTWAAPQAGRRRALVVLRTGIAAGRKRARLLALSGRRPGTAPTPWPFAAPVRAARAESEEVAAASVRLLPYARVRGTGTTHTVDTLVRFDPSRPPVPADEQLAETCNEALGGSGGKRRRTFGAERPLVVDVVLEAHDASCAVVPVVAAGSAAPPGAVVIRRIDRGEATASFDVNPSGQPRVAAPFGAAVSAGRFTLEVPAGVTVTGRARVAYAGPVRIPLAAAQVTVAFRVPAPSYADEWALLSAVLADLDAGTAAQRLADLRAQSCSPLPAACTLDQVAEESGRAVREPSGRWPALQHQYDPQRTFARFVRLMAVAFTWDRDVDYEEYARLNRLLGAIYETGGAPRAAAPRCGISP